ncbi:MAG: C25 family cysteine peptidase [Candidatus Thermoplasmatota archaeon]
MKHEIFKRDVCSWLWIVTLCACMLTLSATNMISASTDKDQPWFSEKHIIKEQTNPVDITVAMMGDTTRLTYHINTFTTETYTLQDGEYVKIKIPHEANLEEKGAPDLPKISRSIIIPDTARMGIRVVNAQYKDLKNIKIIPSKGVFTRDINPESIPYEFGSIYLEDAFYPKALASLSEPYILRDFRGQVVTIYPFTYNPVKGTLRIYTDMTVEVYPDGVDNFNIIERASLPASVDSDFLLVYENHFLNFNTLNRYTPVGEQGKMLVITYGSFWSSMLPFVQWKNMKGVPTVMVNVSQIGTTATQIKNYIVNYYNTKGLTFVLLVGDVAQIPTFTVSNGGSDPTYSYIVGSDHYPDIFVGRFSSSTAAQVQTQVLRSVEYEKMTQVGAGWYAKGSGIASDEGPGHNGEYDYQHIRLIRTKLLNYGYTSVDELYDGSQGGGDASGDPTATMVANVINEGRGIINYCGHGSATSWVTSGFSNTNINALTNENKLPFIWSVACVNGDFTHYDACFAETWLRANRNGKPTGAIATFMSSINQYWDPPMTAQDEFNDILVESYANNKKNTFGGISFNGCMRMNDLHGSSGYTMTDTWHVFGDPSLQVRTKTPVAMTVNHASMINTGATNFEVTVPGVNGALCALSRNYILLGYGYTDVNGYVNIQLSEPLSGTQNVDLVVTAYNKIPYITSIPVASVIAPEKPSGPTKGIASGNTNYQYTTTSYNPGNDLYYKFYWGNGQDSGWIGPYNSGEPATTYYNWPIHGLYDITATVKIGVTGQESPASTPLTVRMYLLGDLNTDNKVDFGDINPFILALTSGETAYYQKYPDGYYYTADINQDGKLDFGDINPFVRLLTGG